MMFHPFLHSALTTFMEYEMAIIAMTICLQELSQAASEHKASH